MFLFFITTYAQAAIACGSMVLFFFMEVIFARRAKITSIR